MGSLFRGVLAGARKSQPAAPGACGHGSALDPGSLGQKKYPPVPKACELVTGMWDHVACSKQQRFAYSPSAPHVRLWGSSSDCGPTSGGCTFQPRERPCPAAHPTPAHLTPSKSPPLAVWPRVGRQAHRQHAEEQSLGRPPTDNSPSVGGQQDPPSLPHPAALGQCGAIPRMASQAGLRGSPEAWDRYYQKTRCYTSLMNG